MLWLDQKYLNFVAFRLDQFTQKKRDVWNSRCPFCGDSKKSDRLKRFYIYPGKKEYSNILVVKCHNCSYSKAFSKFLEEIDPPLFHDYVYERLKERNSVRGLVESRTTVQSTSTLPSHSDDILAHLPTIRMLSSGHSAVEYCDMRKLPAWVYDEFRWADDFKSVAALLNTESAENLRDNDPRIIIPFKDTDGDVTVIQGRTITGAVPKYITIKQSSSADKVFGADKLKKGEPVIVLEGPIDSLFVRNSVATGDSDLIRYKGADSYVFDAQPRNYQIVNKMHDAIIKGCPVFIWPDELSHGKDVNEMVMSGTIDPKTFHETILNNTFTGVMARMRLSTWRKV